MLEAHRPFRGVLEVIRWFQLQPNTEVGLNSGRPEDLRAETLTTLNRLGAESSGVEGTGIGLVITKELVEAMGGQVSVGDTPGGGATFTVSLPPATVDEEFSPRSF